MEPANGRNGIISGYTSYPTQTKRPEQMASPRPYTIEDAYLLLPYSLYGHFTHGGLFGQFPTIVIAQHLTL
jgi:hypothetical protein